MNNTYLCPSTAMDPLQAKRHLESRKQAAAHAEQLHKQAVDAAYKALAQRLAPVENSNDFEL